MARLNVLLFSPTGNTKKIAYEIARGYSGDDIREINITKSAIAESVKGIIIVGTPVYSGRVPTAFAERIRSIEMKGVKAIVVVTYGNRDYEDALLELATIVKEKGADILGAGAFIGEHSLSTKEYPIGEGRPDGEDLAVAYDFGKALSRGKGETRIDEIPGNRPFREMKPKAMVEIYLDAQKCVRCGKCIDVCPVDAIAKDGAYATDGIQCIRCCACIKACPAGARTLTDSVSKDIAKWLFETCKKRKEPELFK